MAPTEVYYACAPRSLSQPPELFGEVIAEPIGRFAARLTRASRCIRIISLYASLYSLFSHHHGGLFSA